ncbi:MAG: Gfo/Idh/MocA family oxidoreductase [Burkholderiales bacterium]|nr:Gfo/Idh/MocA family oxidoreductase [Burkholderiales bacterium]
MRTIRWGIIGCGDVTERKSGPGFAKARNSELRAVMRRTAARAEDYARRHGVPRWHTDADAIIEADDIDAVYIATLTDTHRDYALRCAAAGKPVYVEKPMALDPAQCEEMIAACRAAAVPLWVGYYRRALPRLLAVRDLVADGAIGEVRMAVTYLTQPRPPAAAFAGGVVPWRVNPALSGGGFFFEAVCHTFDFLDFLLGPITEVHGIAANQAGLYDAEDAVGATYRFASGALGSGAWCYDADRDDDYTELIGTRARLRFATLSPRPLLLCRGDTIEERPLGDPEHVHQPLIQTIVDEMNGIGRCPSTGETALRTARVMEAILASFRAQRRPGVRAGT